MTSTDILDDLVAVARSVIGEEFSVDHTLTAQYNEEATRDTIRHYALGIADLNPLWRDEEYGRRSRHGTVIAPPTFPYSVILPSMAVWQDALVRFSQERGVAWTMTYGGTSWDFGRPIRLGDRIHATARLVGAEIKRSRSAGRSVILTGEVCYWSAEAELLARAVMPQIRFPEGTSDPGRTARLQGRGERAADSEPLPSPEELAETVTRRGSVPRYWEDVRPGESLPELRKGRLGVLDLVRWIGGTQGPPLRSTRIAASGQNVSGSHVDPELARAHGIPGMYDNGPLRGGWLGQVVTDWAGDWADLRQLTYRLSRYNVVGDVNTVGGSVLEKLEPADDRSGLVRLGVWVTNDWGQRTAEGTAVVRLPRRERGAGSA